MNGSRRSGRTGLTMVCVARGRRTYDSDALAPLRGQSSSIRGKKHRWEIHYDPYDVDAIGFRPHRDIGLGFELADQTGHGHCARPPHRHLNTFLDDLHLTDRVRAPYHRSGLRRRHRLQRCAIEKVVREQAGRQHRLQRD